MKTNAFKKLLCLLLCLTALTGCAKPQSEGGNITKETVLEYQGQTYRLREDLTTVLIMGLDKYDRPETLEGYTNHMQADFYLLLIMDETNMTCQALHLNRDTMTEIRRLGVGGDVAGKFQGQLALAHTYGSGGSDSCLNAVRAVTTLLGGVRPEHYLTLTMDAVGILNDLLGGITLTVQEDFAHLDPAMQQGAKLTLNGEQALLYVRTRFGIADSSNLNRMERQRQYLDAFYKALMEKNAEDPSFMGDALMKVNDSFMSDCSVTALEELGQLMGQCALGEIHTLPGEALRGEEYMEFYVIQEALHEMVVQLLYQPEEDT